MLRNKLLPTFNAIAEGQTATCDLPLGLRYHAIWLELSDDGTASTGNGADIEATLDNLVGEIRVKINGKVQRTSLASELNQINASNGAAFAAKASGTAGTAGYRVYLPIYFAEPWRKDIAEQRLPAWNMAGQQVESFQIEVQFQNGAGLQTPNVTGFYEFEPATGVLSSIVKWIRQTFGAVGTQQDFNTIDRRDFIQAIHLFNTSDGKYVNKVKFTANGVEVRDRLTTLENQAILLGRELTPDTSATPRFDLVLDYDDPIGGALRADGLAELTLQVEYSAAAAGSMPTIVVRAGPME